MSWVTTGKWLLWHGVAQCNRFTRLSDFVSQSRNAVLMYHAVGEDGYDRVSTDRFERDLQYVTNRYEVVDLPEVLEEPPSGEKKVAITFDDALENVYTNAVPLLREYDAPATIFVVADYVPDGTIAESNAYMDDAQLGKLVDEPLVTLGNHTRSHPHLARLATKTSLEDQIRRSQELLEAKLDVPIRRFCYPYGNYGDAALEMVGATHEYATTTDGRLLNDEESAHEIPRIDAKESEALVRWQLSDASERVKEAAYDLGVIESTDF